MGSRRILLWGLSLLAGGSLIRAAVVEHHGRRLVHRYQEAHALAQQLQQERDHLSGELVNTRQVVEGQAGTINSLQQELGELNGRLQETVAGLKVLQQERDTFQAQNQTLTAQLEATAAAKQELEARLASLKELKLAIRDVKRKLGEQRWAAWRARTRAQQAADLERLASGNRGYVMRQGIPTLGTGIRLHVHVLEPQSQ